MGSGASTASNGATPTHEDLARLDAHFLGRQRLFEIHGLASAVGEELNGRLGEVMKVDHRTGRLAVRLLPGAPVEQWKLLRHTSLRPSSLQVLGDSDTCCSICLEDASEADGVLVRGCACRGSSGATHLSCCLRAFAAARRTAPTTFPTCPTCKEPYHPKVAVTLLLALMGLSQQPGTSAAQGASGTAPTPSSLPSSSTSRSSAADAAAAAPLEFGALVRIAGLATATRLNGMRGLAIERAPGSDRWLVQLEDGSLKSVREAHLVRQSVHSDGSVRDGADGDGGIEAAMVAAQARALGTARGLGSRALSRALSRIAPEHQAARLLGLAYHAAGQQALAVRNLRECVRVAEETYAPEQPAVALALASLGMVLLDSEAQDNAPVSEAIRCLERSLALEEASEASSNASTSAVSSASVDDAIDEAARQQMPTRVPHHVSTRLALAKAYRLRGDPAAGRDLLDRCLKVLGEDVDATASTCTYRPPSTASTSASSSSSTTCAVSPHSSSPAPPEPNTTPNITPSTTPVPKPRDASSLPRPMADMLTVVLEEYAHAELALAAEAASAARDQADTALEELLAQMAHGESDGADHLLIPELEMERAQREGARHAAAHLSRCLEHRERVCGLRHEMLIPLLRRLGATWQHACELPRAAAALERAVDISLHVQGAAGGASADGDSVLACLLSQLRDVYVGQGETAKAGDTQQRIARLCAGSASQPRSQSHR